MCVRIRVVRVRRRGDHRRGGGQRTRRRPDGDPPVADRTALGRSASRGRGRPGRVAGSGTARCRWAEPAPRTSRTSAWPVSGTALKTTAGQRGPADRGRAGSAASAPRHLGGGAGRAGAGVSGPPGRLRHPPPQQGSGGAGGCPDRAPRLGGCRSAGCRACWRPTSTRPTPTAPTRRRRRRPRSGSSGWVRPPSMGCGSSSPGCRRRCGLGIDAMITRLAEILRLEGDPTRWMSAGRKRSALYSPTRRSPPSALPPPDTTTSDCREPEESRPEPVEGPAPDDVR